MLCENWFRLLPYQEAETKKNNLSYVYEKIEPLLWTYFSNLISS